MPDENIPILSYATPPQRPPRFQHLTAIFPFTGGLILGGVITFIVMCTAPRVWVTDDQFFSAAAGLVLSVVATAGYTLVVLLIMGVASSREYSARPPLVSAGLGLAYPLLGLHLVGAFALLCTLCSPSFLGVVIGCLAIFLLCMLLALAAPFLLVHRPMYATRGPDRRGWFPVWAWAGLALLDVAAIGAGRWIAINQFDRDCQAIVASVKANHPGPGTYTGPMIPIQPSLFLDGGHVDVFVVPDGRVILSIQRGGVLGDDRGPVYCSGPLQPNEIHAAINGPTRILIEGAPAIDLQYRLKELDPQHFIEESNW